MLNSSKTEGVNACFLPYTVLVTPLYLFALNVRVIIYPTPSSFRNLYPVLSFLRRTSSVYQIAMNAGSLAGVVAATMFFASATRNSSRGDSSSIRSQGRSTKPADADGSASVTPRKPGTWKSAISWNPASNSSSTPAEQPRASPAKTDDSTVSNPPDTPRVDYHRRRRALKKYIPRKLLLQDARNEHKQWRSQHEKQDKAKPETRHPYVEDIRSRCHQARYQQLREELARTLPQDRSASVVSETSGQRSERNLNLNGSTPPHRHHLHGLRRHRSEPTTLNSTARAEANLDTNNFSTPPLPSAEQYRRAVPGAALGVPVYFQYSCGHLKVRSASRRQRLEIKLRRHRPLMFAMHGMCPICVEMTTTVDGSRRTSGMI